MDTTRRRANRIDEDARGSWLLVALSLMVLLAGPAPVHAQDREWWKEPPESRLDQKSVDPMERTAARIKWDDGSIEVKAGGPALQAARGDAYRRLTEIVEGVGVDGMTVVKTAMVLDPTVRTRVQDRIRSAAIVSEQVHYLPDGGVWAEVVLGLRLRGAGSLTESVGTWAAARPVDPYRPDPSFRVNEPYTGLIVDASGAGFLPALAPRFLEEGTGKVVFGPQMVRQAALSQQGPVEYAVDIRDARQKSRVGINPLIVRALASEGALKGDLALSPRDAERVLAADRAGRFLDRAAVVIVHGKEQRDLAAQPGRRHALVIGIDDYQQADSVDMRLASAARHARAVAALLQRPGRSAADVTLLENRDATRTRVLEALRGLRARVQDEDTVLIFFSGHGTVGPAEDGRLHYYLIPHDGQLANLARTGLKDDEIEEAIGNLPARQVVVILDVGFSGSRTLGIRVRGLDNPTVTAVPAARSFLEASAGRVVISASKPDQPAFEDDQRGGLLTSFLLEGLQGSAADLNGDGAVTVLELFQFVSPKLREYTRRKYRVEQTPVLEIRMLSGEIVMTR